MKKKNGRPNLLEEELKSVTIKFRCTKKEKEALFELSKNYNFSLSEYLLQKALEKKTVSNKIELLSKLDSINLEMTRAGNNINQLAKHANRVKSNVGLDQGTFLNFNLLLNDYKKKIEEVRSIVKLIFKELSK
jgi:hypothetical protein